MRAGGNLLAVASGMSFTILMYVDFMLIWSSDKYVFLLSPLAFVMKCKRTISV